jgi:hypothetical protein
MRSASAEVERPGAVFARNPAITEDTAPAFGCRVGSAPAQEEHRSRAAVAPNPVIAYGLWRRTGIGLLFASATTPRVPTPLCHVALEVHGLGIAPPTRPRPRRRPRDSSAGLLVPYSGRRRRSQSITPWPISTNSYFTFSSVSLVIVVWFENIHHICSNTINFYLFIYYLYLYYL